MNFKLGILGGGLQGTEAVSLARWESWDTILADARPRPPAKDLAGRFVNHDIRRLSDLDRAFPGCDLVIPACEDLPTLELLSQWSRASGQPLAFDLEAYRVSSDKAKSKKLFYQREVPTPQAYPRAAYPLIAKPAGSSGSRGVRLLEGPADFEKFFPDGPSEGWVIEEYCPGPSYSFEVTGRPGAYTAWLATFLGMDEVYDCCRVFSPAGLSEVQEREFRDISLNIAEGLGLNGLMDVEVILTPNGFRVLEIDARLPSQTPTVVYWSLGENLLGALADLFCGVSRPPAVLREKARPVSYEHVAVSPSGVKAAGEHIMSSTSPLWLEENFFGADWALSDYRQGSSAWSATLIMMADSPEELEDKRDRVWKKIGQKGAAAVKPQPGPN